MTPMAWCCEAFEARIGATDDDGFGVYYSYHEPPHNPPNKLFLLHYRSGSDEGSARPGIRIFFCPWCGADLSRFPAAEPQEAASDLAI
jgi:hypothetical protein